MKPVRVRHARRPDDLDAIVALNQADAGYNDSEWEEEVRGDKPEGLPLLERYRRWGPWVDRELLDNYMRAVESVGGVLVAQTPAGEIVGQMDYVVGPDPPRGMTAGLVYAVTHPAYRRQGIGRSLFNSLKSLDTLLPCKTITTGPEDEIADQFYRSLGFVEKGMLFFMKQKDSLEGSEGRFPTCITLRHRESLPASLPDSFEQVVGANYHPTYNLAQARVGVRRRELLGLSDTPSQRFFWLQSEDGPLGFMIVETVPRLWLSEREYFPDALAVLLEKCYESGVNPLLYLNERDEGWAEAKGFERVDQEPLLEWKRTSVS